MYFIFWYDYVLLPFYLLAMVMLLNAYYKRHHGNNNPELRHYFNRGLTFKIIGCISIGLIYEYYYNGSYDGRFYFEGAKVLSQYWKHNPGEFFTVLRQNVTQFDLTNVESINMEQSYIFADSSFTVCKVAGIFNLLSFNAFLPCSLFFCGFAYIAIWNLLLHLHKEYSIPLRLAAFTTIYIPSVIIWDAGIFKDTISFSCMCWLFICSYNVFIKRRKIIFNIIGMTLSAILIAEVKIYILAAFAPGLMLYIFTSYKNLIKNNVLRSIAAPIVLFVAIITIGLFLRNSSELLGQYSIDQVLETSNATYTNITEYGGKAGSSYSLDINLNSNFGILMAIPTGINLTLFRPYPWEYLSLFILMASLESMIILYYTIFVIYKIGIFRVLRIVLSSSLVQFCLLFSLTFAFLVGLSAANFGTLVRYKIPCLPFYLLALITIYQVGMRTKSESTESSMRR